MVIPDSIFRTHHVVAVVVMVVVKTAVRVGCRGLQCWAEIRLDNVLYQQGADGLTSSVSLVARPAFDISDSPCRCCCCHGRFENSRSGWLSWSAALVGDPIRQCLV